MKSLQSQSLHSSSTGTCTGTHSTSQWMTLKQSCSTGLVLCGSKHLYYGMFHPMGEWSITAVHTVLTRLHLATVDLVLSCVALGGGPHVRVIRREGEWVGQAGERQRCNVGTVCQGKSTAICVLHNCGSSLKLSPSLHRAAWNKMKFC